MVLVGLTSSFNLAAALLQVFWISMSLIGIAVTRARLKARSSKPRSRPADRVEA